MIIDFVNDPAMIKEDFQKFYGKNYMDEEHQTDPNSLYDVQNKIDSYNLIYQTEIEAFANIFFRRGDAKSFVKLYRFLRGLMTYIDIELEKYYVFLVALIKKLPYIQTSLPLDVLSEVELHSYKIQHKYTTDLELVSGDGEMEGMKPGGGGHNPE